MGTAVNGDDGWPVLGPAAYLGPAGDYAIDCASETEADPVAVLVSELAMCSTMIGSGPYMLAGNDRHAARLFAVVVGDTHKGGKGTSYAVAREPAWIAFPDLEGRTMGGFGSGEHVVDMVRDAGKDNAGKEKPGAPDKRLLIFEAEFARFLRLAGRKDAIHSEIVREAWDGHHRLQTRARTSGDVVATGYHICFLGHITRPELAATLSDTEVWNGFSNRFLWVLARRRHLLPDGGNVPESVIRRSARKLQERVEGARRHGQMKRTEAGEQRWADLYYRLAEDEPGGLLGAAISRDAPQCLRLSLLYALLEGARGVEARHVDAAEALWDYCRASAALIFGDSLGDRNADRLLAALRKAGPVGLDGREQHDVFERNVSAAELERVRQLLVAKGLAVVYSEQTAGRQRQVMVATS